MTTAFHAPAIALTITALSFLVFAGNANAQTLRVSTYGNSNSGTTWSAALRTVNEALDRAETDPSIARIEVAAGTYKPGGSRTASFVLVDNVTMVGGYPPAGGGTPSPDLYPTILSGDIGVAGDSSDNSYTVVLALSVEGARLEGFRIRNGTADLGTSGPFAHGGGIYVEHSSLVILDCRFYKNMGRFGGAVSVWSSAVTMSGCRFTDNDAFSGGAIANNVHTQAGDVLVDRCWFLGNTASSYGGAILNASRLSLYNSVLSGNQSFSYGGAVCASASGHETRIINCTLTNNRAAVDGGAYYGNLLGMSRVLNSICWHNTDSGPANELAPASIGYVHHCNIEGMSTLSLSGHTNMELNPLFVDELGPDGVAGTADDNPRIDRASPCVNEGDNSAVPTFAGLDIDDADRIQRPWLFLSEVVDIGANEIGPFLVQYPGSGNVVMRLLVNGMGNGIAGTDAVFVPAGSHVEAIVLTPNAGLVGLPGLVSLDPFIGSAAPAFSGLSGAHFGPGAAMVFVGLTSSQGLSLTIPAIPTGLTGSFMMQGLVLSPQATNGLFAGSDGRELRF